MNKPSPDYHAGLEDAFRRELPRWFECHRRPLPWRRLRTPYRVWIAEIMLQQTRVDQAAPYYVRFMRRFPTLRALAGASRRDVLKAWEGLGYYARARRLHDIARCLVKHGGGRFPRTHAGLLALPGIGPYTAAAIGSLAMDLDLAVVDGNVERVIARVLGLETDVRSAAGRRAVRACVERLLPPGRSAQFNEALMELGALCCLPRRPRCAACPLRKVCRARAQGDPERYPRRKRAKAVPHKIVSAGVVLNRKREVLLAQRLETSMLGGLWEFPGGTQEAGESIRQCLRRELMEELGIRVRVGRHLVTVPHAFSHFTMDLHAYWARIERGRPRARQCADFAWVRPGELGKYPMPRADLVIRDRVLGVLAPQASRRRRG
ncbi:MAG: A/G-specific adenine glycosylase [Kiritimatiellae bacterium]|nr:A/G-specific adenine glycosylase [Kiritimatiellia bacterium]